MFCNKDRTSPVKPALNLGSTRSSAGNYTLYYPPGGRGGEIRAELRKKVDLLGIVQKHMDGDGSMMYTFCSRQFPSKASVCVVKTGSQLPLQENNPPENYLSKVLHLLWNLSVWRTSSFLPERVITEYRGLERISTLRKQGFIGEPEIRRIEYDYLALGEQIETNHQRPGMGRRPRGPTQGK